MTTNDPKTLDLRADLTAAAWTAIVDLYNEKFVLDRHIHWDDFWEWLRLRGFAIRSLDCSAALEVIAAVKAHRETELAERRVMRWYRRQP